LYKIVAIALVLFLTVKNIHGQGSPYIEYVKEFPIPEWDKTPDGIFKSVGKFFFGKTPIIITKPISVLALNPDKLWILDQGTGKIISLENNKATIPSFTNNSKHNFSSLLDLAFLTKEEILFTDSRLNHIFQLNTKDENLTILNDSLKLNQPTGIAYSSKSDQIWVVETASHQISILNKKGDLVKKIGKRGSGYGEFNFPTFITINKSGFVYVVDAMNFRIQIFDLDGKFIASFGQVGNGSGSFASPKGIATDSFGNVYIVDALFHAVQIFDKSGTFLYAFGKQGHGTEEFWMPTGICIDDENFIYITDTYNSRVQIFKLMNGR
jgi:DNA-binding beta-propeller fold protein YncE